jgi:hypothetical protein
MNGSTGYVDHIKFSHGVDGLVTTVEDTSGAVPASVARPSTVGSVVKVETITLVTFETNGTQATCWVQYPAGSWRRIC